VEGVRRAFAEAGEALEDEHLVHAGAAMEDGHRAALQVLARPEGERPTALFCYNDLVAIGAMGAAFSLGLRVPEDLSIVGYDDIRMASHLPVPLTTIRVPRHELGRQAAALIIEQVFGRADVRGHHIKMDAELVVRASTQSPAQ
jgi:DNA-binding LacI/PurR family transcriptional regulator